MGLDAHGLGEERSIAMHSVIAERLARDPSIVASAKERVDAWLRSGEVHPRYAAEWKRVLALPLDELVAVLVDRSDAARALRSVSPFAGVLEPRERWRLHRAVRRAVASDEAG